MSTLNTENETEVMEETTEDTYRPIGPTVRFSYTVRMRDQMGFLFRYAFAGLNGLAFWLVMGLLAWRIISGWSTDTTAQRTMLFFGVFILIVLMPGTLFMRAWAQCKIAKMNKLVSNYEISSAGIYVTQETEHQLVKWEEIRSVQVKSKVIYLYVFKNSAFICPKDVLGKKWKTLQAIIKENYVPKN